MQRRLMERDYVGGPIAPNPIPNDPEQLLALMDEALQYAGTGGAGSNAFEHGVRLFNQFRAHFEVVTARETAAAHAGLTSATRALKIATWWLAAITVLLGAVEGVKMCADTESMI
jgi:hypothetical protein